MKLTHLSILAFILVATSSVYSQEADLRKASVLGDVMTENNEADFFYGNWEVIVSKSDAENIDLMSDQEGPTGQYFILKSTNERSAVSSYIEDGYHSVDLGFYVYRKGDNFYGNLDASVAVVFESEHSGELIEFKCEYLKDEDQLKLTTSKNVVFYLKRFK